MAESGQSIACTDSMNEMVAQFVRALEELDSMKNPSLSLQSKIPVESTKNCLHKLQKLFEIEFSQLEEKENSFEEMKSEIQEVLAEREAMIVDRERTLLDRLQEIKDASVSAIVEARKKHNMASSSKLGPPGILNKSNKFAEANDNKVMTLNELKQFCKLMDVEGVLRFVTCKRKQINSYSLREELSTALKCARQPASLVLNSLERLLFPSIPANSIAKCKDISPDIIKSRACLVLMESVVLGCKQRKNYEIKHQAKVIARKWKAILGHVDINSRYVNKLEAQGFIQLLVTFGISEEFDENDLCELVFVIPNTRRAPVLCQSLGLAHRAPEMIEAFLNNGKQIPAIHFIHAFGLGKNFPVVYLLKDFLSSVRRQANLKAQINGPAGVKAANHEELLALRKVVQCVEEYELQREYNLDPLQTRILQLVNAKAKNLKVAADTANNRVKRARVHDNENRVNKRPANGVEYWDFHGERGLHSYDHEPSFSMVESRNYPLKFSY